MSIDIRNFDDADLEACRDLWVVLTQTHRDLYQAPEIGGAEPGLQFDEHLATVGADRIWVAVDNGDVVGLTGLIVTGHSGELEPLVVAPDHRGRGIGRALADQVIQTARDLGLVELSVRPVARNQTAISMFHGLGFDVIGHVELFMWLGEARRWQGGETIAERDFLV